MDLRPINSVIGILLAGLAGMMMFPAMADAQAGNPDWRIFASVAALTFFVGMGLWLASRSHGVFFSNRHGFALVALVWTVVPAFGAIPFMLSALNLSLTDAYFEAVSGLTTTGSTILTALNTLPPGILLWRAMLQWMGGLGIIVMAISLLPMLQIGGMQMFRVEAFETFGKSLPRIRQVSGHITIIFVGFTLALAVALMLAGMSGLDASVHAMTTIATGGYSTYDDSIGHFDSATIEFIITFGMFLGGIPFVLYAKFFAGDSRPLLVDEQVRLYAGILVASIAAVGLWLILNLDYSLGEALRYASFNVTSIMTGTGYVSTDYGAWGGFPILLLVALTFLGGCAGSTACGIKVFRVQLIFKAGVAQLRQMIYPNGVFKPQFNGHSVEPTLIISVATVLFGYLVLFLLLSGALTIVGLDPQSAFSSAATAISNVGPGLGEIVGPTGTFQVLPDAAKWLLVAGMLLGRLELLTFLALFSPLFWRK